jgi:formate/nitrite transporter FocA (FNT family)
MDYVKPADVAATMLETGRQIPVTLGNLVGGFLFTGLAIYMTHASRSLSDPVQGVAPAPMPAE